MTSHAEGAGIAHLGGGLCPQQSTLLPGPDMRVLTGERRDVQIRWRGAFRNYRLDARVYLNDATFSELNLGSWEFSRQGKMTKGNNRLSTAVIGLGLCLIAVSSSQAADFYEGKTINLIVGNDAGTGFDAYGRLLARHMPKYLAGKPTIVVQNMIGAGGAVAAQHLFNSAPRDGSTFALLTPGAIADPLLEPAKFRYDPTKFGQIGTAESLTRICFTGQRSNVRTMEDARRTKVVLGGTSPGNSASDYGPFLNAVAGTKFETVNGYKSSAELLLALERGEIEGICSLDMSAIATQRPSWFGSKDVNFLVQVAFEPNPAMSKFGIPSFWDFVTDGKRQIAELYVSQQIFGRPFVAPPGIPEPRLLELQTAFLQAMRDPEAVEDARKNKLELNPKSGRDVSAVLEKLYATDALIIQAMRQALKQ